MASHSAVHQQGQQAPPPLRQFLLRLLLQVRQLTRNVKQTTAAVALQPRLALAHPLAMAAHLALRLVQLAAHLAPRLQPADMEAALAAALDLSLELHHRQEVMAAVQAQVLALVALAVEASAAAPALNQVLLRRQEATAAAQVQAQASPALSQAPQHRLEAQALVPALVAVVAGVATVSEDTNTAAMVMAATLLVEASPALQYLQEPTAVNLPDLRRRPVVSAVAVVAPAPDQVEVAVAVAVAANLPHHRQHQQEATVARPADPHALQRQHPLRHLPAPATVKVRAVMRDLRIFLSLFHQIWVRSIGLDDMMDGRHSFEMAWKI